MCVDAEAKLADLKRSTEMNGPIFKQKDDPRITRVGRFIRKCGIDELPQLWDILVGSMSIVAAAVRSGGVYGLRAPAPVCSSRPDLHLADSAEPQ